MADKTQLTLVTPKFRMSFPQLFEAKSQKEGKPAKFSVDMLFDKKTDLSDLKKIANKAITDKWGAKPPKGIRSPFKDGNTKDLEGYEDTIVVKASSRFAPPLVDQNKQPITSPNELYAGCYARASVTAEAYEYTEDKMTSRGVRFFLNAVQKVADGEPFVKRVDHTEAFESLDDDSLDKSNYENDDDDFML